MSLFHFLVFTLVLIGALLLVVAKSVISHLISNEAWARLPMLARSVARLAARWLARGREEQRRYEEEFTAHVSELASEDRRVTALVTAFSLLASAMLYAARDRRLLTRDSRDMAKARRQVAAAARRLPPSHRERYAEQWLRDLEEIEATEGAREACRWAIRIRCWQWRVVRSELRRARKRKAM